MKRNIPIEFVTKGVISDEAIELIRGQIHSFAQVSILTPNEELRRVLVPDGATTDQLLKELILQAQDAGVGHIVAATLNIPRSIWNLVNQGVWASLAYEYSRLYQELIDNYYNAKIDYRKRLFYREESDRRGVSFALCMEYGCRMTYL